MAGEIARGAARRFAATVDRENRFPSEAVEALRDAGLFGLLVPRSAGGLGGAFSDSFKIGEILGRECLSTAMIWAMHSQQIGIMVDHAARQWRDELADISANGVLVASATTEAAKGSRLTLTKASLQPFGAGIRVERPSPFVSYGEQAGYYLITMRRGPDRPETDGCFVLLKRCDGQVTGGWEAMGMRGTRTVAMHLRADIDAGRILAQDFRHIASATAIPAAHLGWTSAWYGAARGALDRFLMLLRSNAGERRRFESELFCARLAEVRLSLDLLWSILDRLIRQFEDMRTAGAPAAAYQNAEWTLALNGLKVAGSRIAIEAVDQLIELAGLKLGYLRDEERDMERVFRDLRSATLMVKNDALLLANAKHLLFDYIPEGECNEVTK
jgi:alkylation response protein AidB-like acyl-CoA dehydrogenase